MKMMGSLLPRNLRLQQPRLILYCNCCNNKLLGSSTITTLPRPKSSPFKEWSSTISTNCMILNSVWQQHRHYHHRKRLACGQHDDRKREVMELIWREIEAASAARVCRWCRGWRWAIGRNERWWRIYYGRRGRQPTQMRGFKILRDASLLFCR